MSRIDRQRLAIAVERVLSPLAAHAKIVGMSRRDFAALARRAFQTSATAAAPVKALALQAVAVRVVSRWLADPAYTRGGKPRFLNRTGTGSFAALVRDARGGSATSILTELQRGGIVDVDRQGRLRLLQKAYIPTVPDAKVDFLGTAGADFLRVILHNLVAAPPDSFLQRAASYDNIGALSTAMLRRTLRREGERALLRANALLASRDRDRNPSAPGGRRTRVAFGVYYFEEPVGRAGRNRRKR